MSLPLGQKQPSTQALASTAGLGLAQEAASTGPQFHHCWPGGQAGVQKPPRRQGASSWPLFS